MNVKDHLNSLPKPLVITLGVIILGMVGVIDYLTGPNFSLSILYLIPVLLVSWYAGRLPGIAISVACALTWLVASLLAKKYHEYPVVLYWNDMMELAFFLTVTILITALKSSLQREMVLAKTDYLTKLPNRRCFFEFSEKELGRSLRYRHPLTIIYLDIDNFKTVNDTMGHSAGNDLLCLVAGTLSRNIRSTDMVARLGGDEFALLLPESDAESARNVVRKVMNSLKGALKDDWPVTFSVGMVTYMLPPASVDEMVKKADNLMYAVKLAGKGAVRHEVVEH
ncbi:diguanylate cyclase [Geobacter sp.]|uniref:diguanylate cyclase n=1 Tax=Geobacter sp. TaxID=46610 RepID=UPI001AD37E75|nr:diguanylate cyclase [Geobacter sp.]CAG0957392.1 putative diguanylate cyclase DgcT [Geobacteraceae bacterium]